MPMFCDDDDVMMMKKYNTVNTVFTCMEFTFSRYLRSTFVVPFQLSAFNTRFYVFISRS